jgi:hypothetical protein
MNIFVCTYTQNIYTVYITFKYNNIKYVLNLSIITTLARLHTTLSTYYYR